MACAYCSYTSLCLQLNLHYICTYTIKYSFPLPYFYKIFKISWLFFTITIASSKCFPLILSIAAKLLKVHLIYTTFISGFSLHAATAVQYCFGLGVPDLCTSAYC